MIKKVMHKVESDKARCIKTVYVLKDYIKICGRFATKSVIIKSHDISYKLDLCKECFEELEEKKKEEKEKVKKDYEKTDFKCPECGSPVFKHRHIKSGLYPEYRLFWCPNYCDLYCHNCKHGTDTHGDVCGAFFCLNGSGWEPFLKTPIIPET